jgi:hypothetical protein
VTKGAKAGVGCAFALIASLVLARVHPFGDAGLYAASGGDRRALATQQMPSEVRAIMEAKCADCHSNQTRAPFYGHFAPASWLMERDIVQARIEAHDVVAAVDVHDFAGDGAGEVAGQEQCAAPPTSS